MKLNYYSLIILSLLVACFSSSYLNQKNLAHLYQKDKMFIHPTIQVFHINDSITNVLLMYNSIDLLHLSNEETNSFFADLKVSYNLYKSMESSVSLQSGSITFNHKSAVNDSNHVISGKIKLKIKNGEKYILELLHSDINRKHTHQNFCTIDKLTPNSAQNFILNDEDGNIIFGNTVQTGESFIIKHNKKEPNIYCRYYNRHFATPAPPFSINNPKPFDFDADSTFIIKESDTIQFSHTGFYHFQVDTLTTNGFTVFCFKPAFPYISTTEEMMGPLKYLTSKKEFQNIIESKNKKEEIDKFWLKNSSSPERAKYLIKTYYNRVQDANLFFTSFKEGWKTDRGMIYIVFGPPSTIYKSSESESWIYGSEKNYLSYNFNFINVDNPFTNNDFMLNRSNVYRYSWSQALETWRRGKVYNVTDIKREQDERKLRQQMHFWY